MDLNEAHSRYKSLIQPIKDLAANWDVDIADSLTDYLEELENLRISLDDGQTSLNFAEAALLIQGSAAIYSKKVEYLYQLVLQSIEFITKKKSNVLMNKVRGSKVDGTSMMDDDLLLFGSDPSFLLLDHVIEEGINIDMKVSTPAEHSRFSLDSVHYTTELYAIDISNAVFFLLRFIILHLLMLLMCPYR
jgi:condensin-2 complex subunit H2